MPDGASDLKRPAEFDKAFLAELDQERVVPAVTDDNPAHIVSRMRDEDDARLSEG